MYNIEWIKTVAECDALITDTEAEKAEVEVDIVNLVHKQGSLSNHSSDFSAEYAANQVQLDSLNAVIPTLPDGKAKKDNVKTQKRLEYKQFLLDNRKESYSVFVMLKTQHKLTLAQKELAEKLVFLSELAARKAELLAA